MAPQRGHQDRTKLLLSHDRKVSQTGWWQESRRRWVPTTPNSFGLPSGVTCPGKTSFCVSCYAKRTEGMAGVQGLVDHNLAMLLEAGTVDAMAELLTEMIGRYDAEAARRKLDGRLFRIHWDGDFFSIDYAEAWARTIRAWPTVQFWCYTRSFVDPVNVVPVLAWLDNLALYLSVDDENSAIACQVLDRWPVRAALCAEDWASARALVNMQRRPVVCPENAERVGLMTEGVGACVTCGICVDGSRDVLFSTSHREHAGTPVAIR